MLSITNHQGNANQSHKEKPVRIAIIKNKTINAGEDTQKGGTHTLSVGMQISTAVMENNMKFP
jgi:hypothetical protein